MNTDDEWSRVDSEEEDDGHFDEDGSENGLSLPKSNNCRQRFTPNCFPCKSDCQALIHCPYNSNKIDEVIERWTNGY